MFGTNNVRMITKIKTILFSDPTLEGQQLFSQSILKTDTENVIWMADENITSKLDLVVSLRIYLSKHHAKKLNNIFSGWNWI